MTTLCKIKYSLYRSTCLMGGVRYFFKPVLIGWLLVAVIGAQAATFYVSPAGNDANNGTTWELAKQSIQAGINVANSGDTILVADGIYGPISVSAGITVRSVNGAEVTTIDGGGVTLCAYLYNAGLDGFTVMNGYGYLGGGVYVEDGTVQNCTIRWNSAFGGGGVYATGGTVANCTIRDNNAYIHGGGGLVNDCTTVKIKNCTISGNSAGYGGGLSLNIGSSIIRGGTVENCTISGNTASEYGGGVHVEVGTVKNCTISGNMARWGGGGLSISEKGAMVENCTITKNMVKWNGGGVFLTLFGGPGSGGTLRNCTISGNTAELNGGGVSIVAGTARNCVISGNMATDRGGGVWSGGGTVENCTIVRNWASISYGGMYLEGGAVRNCIAYYNQDADVIDITSSDHISYSCTGTSIPGAGNITNEPQFVSLGTDYGPNHVPGNYHLRPTSPCINAGTNQSWMADAVDLDGLPRILDGVVDMGAYEGLGANNAIMRNPPTLINQCNYGSNAASQAIEVWNGGTNIMAYVLSADVGWISLSPASGTSLGETDVVSVNYSSTTLLPGTYTSIVTITSAEAINSPQVVTVYLTVDEIPPEILADLEVSDLKFVPGNLWAGDHPAMISFDLVNDGPADIVAPGTQMEITFCLSSNTIFGDEDDIAIGTITEGVTLSAGSQITIRNPGRAHNQDVTIPEGLSGDFYVFVNVRLVSQSDLSDPDGAVAMRDGPIRVRIHPSDGGEDIDYRIVVNDYDGDGLSDIMAYDEPSGEWAIRLSESGEWVQFAFGGPGYETVSGDYDGDLKTDPAVHQKKGSQWHLMMSAIDYQTISFDFGGEGETRGVVGDYNMDWMADPGLYEEGNGRWYVLLPNAEDGSYQIASVMFGGPGWTPVAGDYDGDGCADPAVYAEETGEWRVMLSDKGYEVAEAVMGGPGYSAAVGDYDGDGKSDPAVVSAGGEWYYWLSSRGYSLSGPDAFGKSGPGFAGGSAEASIPVPGDYDGDGKADPAIVDSDGNWHVWLSGSFYTIDGPYPGYFTKIREMSGSDRSVKTYDPPRRTEKLEGEAACHAVASERRMVPSRSEFGSPQVRPPL